MSKETVDNIAQGRVWIGETALELNLVDHLGYIDDAVSAAAARANLSEYDVTYVERSLNSSELFWKELFSNASVMLAKTQFAQSDSKLISLINKVTADFDNVAKLNDPRGVYAFCLTCDI